MFNSTTSILNQWNNASIGVHAIYFSKWWIQIILTLVITQVILMIFNPIWNNTNTSLTNQRIQSMEVYFQDHNLQLFKTSIIKTYPLILIVIVFLVNQIANRLFKFNKLIIIILIIDQRIFPIQIHKDIKSTQIDPDSGKIIMNKNR